MSDDDRSATRRPARARRSGGGRRGRTLTDHLNVTGGVRRTRRRRLPIALLITVVLILVAGLGAIAVALPLAHPSMTLRASSTALGTSAERLTSAPESGRRAETWRTSGQTVGASLDFSWQRPTRIGRISWRAPGSSTITSMLATFGDGSSLLLTADDHGDVDSRFPARTVTSLSLVVGSTRPAADAVALSAVRVGADPDHPSFVDLDDGQRGVSASASSSGTSQTPAALSDGSAGSVTALGRAWSPAGSDDAPWVELHWQTPRRLTSVQLFGPAGDVRGPGDGTLVFSDGSTITVGAVRGDGAPPTLVGFAPRIVTSVRFVMSGTNGGLREFRAYGAGHSPAAPPETAGFDLPDSPAASCSQDRTVTQNQTLTLLCPTTGASVDGTFAVVVSAPPARELSISAFLPFPGGAADDGAPEVLQRTRSSSSGRARFNLDSSKLPAGPVNLTVELAGQERPLIVQVLNSDGRSPVASTAGRKGRTLLWQDDFSGRISASPTGARTTYASTKPEYGGSSQFGDAIFADPAWSTANLGTVDGGYLRMRLSPKGDLPQAESDSRKQLGALISSSAVGGGGTSVQYGYFEARILGAPGQGTWPAFWMLTNPSLVRAGGAGAEVDAVELYGRDTSTACHALHSYPGDKSTIRCLPVEPSTDWSTQWHTYGVDIRPDGSRFYVDGKLVVTLTGQTHTAEAYYFLLNLASGGGWPVDLSATRGVSDMYVDWVRVYS